MFSIAKTVDIYSSKEMDRWFSRLIVLRGFFVKILRELGT